MPNVFFYSTIIGLTSGILFRSFFDIRVPDVVFILFLSFTLALVWRLHAETHYSTLLVVSIFLMSLGVGVIRMEYADNYVSPLRDKVGNAGTWEGIIVREPDVRESSVHLYIREHKTGALFLATTNPYTEIAYGDSVSVAGTLGEPEPFQTDGGRTFAYDGYLRTKGVTEMISFATVEVLERGKGNPILAHLYGVKQALIESLEDALPEPSAGLGEGILLGVKRALGEDLTETFRIAGIIHIVVLSGYNIMIVADSVMRALGYFFYPRTRLIAGLTAILFFALLVGLSATVVRASIMAALVLIARHIGRQYAVLRALCLTGVLMLFMNPYLLVFDPGFQLSFLATLGLILLTPPLEERLTRVPHSIRGYLASTLGTQLAVLPILIFSMGTVSLVSVLVNLLVLPVVPLAMFLTFVTGVLGLVSGTLGFVLGFGAHAILMYIVKVASLAASLPFAEITLPPLHPTFLVFMLLGVVAIAYLWNRPRTVPVENAYDGWVIETENETPLAAGNATSGVSDPFPFK